MSRRRPPTEQAIGSDSFLDVLANMVGILIILIVIAGLRVSQTAKRTAAEKQQLAAELAPEPPTESPTATAPAPVVAPEVAEAEFDVQLGEADQWPVEFNPLPLNAPESLLVLEAPAPIPAQPPAELVLKGQELTSTLKNFLATTAQLQLQAEALRNLLPSSVVAVDVDKQLEAEAANLTKAEQQATALRDAIKTAEQKLDAAQTELAKAAAVPPPTQVMKHHLNPVSKAVTGREIHFLLDKNKVSVVPIDSLANELQRQLKRQRDMLLNRERYDGRVGPLGGFEMAYVIERARPTLGDGGLIIRMEVSSWVLHPLSNLATETGDQALTPGSHFLRAIQTSPGAALTFWVYPDSFAVFRHLQDAAQSSGLRTAARPLPEGVPIAGSPKGSKSLAQ